MVTAKPSADVIELTRQWQEAFHAGDESFASQHLGHGEVMMLGSAPEDEVFRGRDNVLGLTIERAKQINDGAGVSNDLDRELETQAWEAGDTGWVVTQGNWPMADGATIPTRSIAVYARDEDGAWKAVFSAAHVLVPNDALRPESPAYPLLANASSVGAT